MVGERIVQVRSTPRPVKFFLTTTPFTITPAAIKLSACFSRSPDHSANKSSVMLTMANSESGRSCAHAGALSTTNLKSGSTLIFMGGSHGTPTAPFIPSQIALFQYFLYAADKENSHLTCGRFCSANCCTLLTAAAV